MAIIQEVVTVSDARANLSRILGDLESAGRHAAPVLIGSHRKAQGVLLSVEVFEELAGRDTRRQAVESARSSLAVEALHASPEAEANADEYARGAITLEELGARTLGRYLPSAERGSA